MKELKNPKFLNKEKTYVSVEVVEDGKSETKAVAADMKNPLYAEVRDMDIAPFGNEKVGEVVKEPTKAKPKARRSTKKQKDEKAS